MISGTRVCVGISLALLVGGLAATLTTSKVRGESEVLGQYFAKKQYTPEPIPKFAALREQLPSPIYDAKPLWVQVYWKAWELASKNFYEPPPGSGFVSAFIDAAFNKNIFLWDSCFMSMFCNYGYPLVPGISTLDNFYAKQHEDGEICREIVRAKGVDFAPWTNPTHQPLFSRWGWPGYLVETFHERSAPVHYQGRSIPQPPPSSPSMASTTRSWRGPSLKATGSRGTARAWKWSGSRWSITMAPCRNICAMATAST